MNRTPKKQRRLRRAADMVVEYAIVALRPKFLIWEKTVNMRLAELVWNAFSLGEPHRIGAESEFTQSEFSEPKFTESKFTESKFTESKFTESKFTESKFSESRFTEIIDRLTEMRCTRWPDEKFLVLGLDVRHESGDLLFRFDLTWDQGRSFHPCEIAWDPLGVRPALN